MTSLNEVVTRKPSEFFLGVVELENTLVVGIIDDPVGVELTAVRLGYPLEFVQKWEGSDVSLGILVPEAGIPDEIIIDAGAVSVHGGASGFGLQYFENLKTIMRIAPRQTKAKHISRNDLFKGAPSGLRERA